MSKFMAERFGMNRSHVVVEPLPGDRLLHLEAGENVGEGGGRGGRLGVPCMLSKSSSYDIFFICEYNAHGAQSLLGKLRPSARTVVGWMDGADGAHITFEVPTGPIL
jgi:hypothetical protein